MRTRPALLFACALACGNAIAQPPIEWAIPYGGSDSDGASCIQQTPDGGYIMAGSTTSSDGDVTDPPDGADCWVVKLDALGGIAWNACLGGSGNDGTSSIEQTSDGGYILAGISDSDDGDVVGAHGERDGWLVKLDATGNITWQRPLGGSGQDRIHGAVECAAGGFIAVGNTYSFDGDVSGNLGYYDAWVVRLDDQGTLMWQRCLGGNDAETIFAVRQATDGGYILVGNALSTDGDVSGNHGQTDLWVVKLDASGEITWQKCFGGSGIDEGADIRLTPDGGYLAGGQSNSTDGDVSGVHGVVASDFWIVKMDADGNLQWQKALGGGLSDYINCIQVLPDGGALAAGRTSSSTGDVSGDHGYEDYWVVRTDAMGELLWQHALGGSNVDEANTIAATNDGGCIVAGSVTSTNGQVQNSHGSGEAWVVKLGDLNVGVTAPMNAGLVLSPNPSNGVVQLTLPSTTEGVVQVLNATGALVLQQRLNGPHMTLDLGGCSAGVHHVRLVTSAGMRVERLVLVP